MHACSYSTIHVLNVIPCARLALYVMPTHANWQHTYHDGTYHACARYCNHTPSVNAHCVFSIVLLLCCKYYCRRQMLWVARSSAHNMHGTKAYSPESNHHAITRLMGFELGLPQTVELSKTASSRTYFALSTCGKYDWAPARLAPRTA